MRDRMDNQIEEIVAACDGSMQDALRALMMINERLESELERLQSGVVCGHACSAGRSLH